MWGAFTRSGVVLCGDRVLVDEAAESVVSVDRGGSRHRVGWCWRPGFWRRQSECAVRAMAVVMVDELCEHASEVSAVCDQQSVEALASGGADESLAGSVCLRCADGGADDLNAFCVEDGVEGVRELAVVVTDQELQGCVSVREREREVPGLLGSPGSVGVFAHAGEVHAPGGELDKNRT